MSRLVHTLLTAIALSCAAIPAQSPPQTISIDDALDHALEHSSLTAGATPFHARMEIAGPNPSYTGRLDLVWLAADRYRLTIDSPAFRQTRTVADKLKSEETIGAYYPRWLENFVDALLDPIPAAGLFRGGKGTLTLAENRTSCIQRDDNPGGITDQMTWGNICFIGTEPLLQSCLATNRGLTFEDYRSFGDQQIARTYKTYVLDYKEVAGHLTVLEKLQNLDPTQISVAHPTLEAESIKTLYVSTLKEESLVDNPPNITWPSVREGKTDGYMIVYARTDRTGQVRETAKHNSDNPGLEQFGMEQALRYKFHPLIVDGVAQQMEMPLVLHFSSRLVDPLPMLSDTETRQHAHGCDLPRAKNTAQSYRVIVSVNEDGKLTGETFPDANKPDYQRPARFPDLRGCHFDVFRVNGQPSYYHGELILPR